ncbi:MAG: PAS domain-containing protein [Methanoregula sp.]|nr:PAS domain-containing protein [Methanoregula sp.]
MDISRHVTNDLIELFIVTAAVIGAILSSVFSLSQHIFEVFPFLYILPIILVVYFYPGHGQLFTLCISLVYLGLVWFFSPTYTTQIIIAAAWFAIFIIIGVVASSYANRLRDEEKKIKKVLETAQDGIFCFELRSNRLHEINSRCARMLKYEREELLGKDLSQIWWSETERADFISCVREGQSPCKKEVLLVAKDGTPHHYLISAILSTNHVVICSAIDTTLQKKADEDIRQAFEELEQQVRERTAHLEKSNEQLMAEIEEHRRIESAILNGEQQNDKRERGT